MQQAHFIPAGLQHQRAVARRFGPDYLERLVLRDGRPVRLVALRPEHEGLVIEGFARLSQRSRYLRFFGSKRVLRDAELQRLLTQDEDRYALGAIVDGPEGPEGVAIGRIVRSEDDPDAAEVAITVIDAYQREGLGRLLLDRLQEIAQERGFTRVCGDVLAENRPMLALLRVAIPKLRTELDGTVVKVEWSVGSRGRALGVRCKGGENL